MKTGQRKLLRLLAKHQDNISAAIGYTFEVFIIYGDTPYYTVKIVQLKDDRSVEIDREELIKFLEFEVPFDKLTALGLPF